MLNKLIFLAHETAVILNDPGKETITAGLGPIAQYGITLLALIIVGIVYFIRKRKRKNANEDILKVKQKRNLKQKNTK